MTNSEFKEKFEECLNGTIQERIDKIKLLIDNSSKDLPKKTILTDTDFREYGKAKLEDIIRETVYNSPNGSYIVVNGRIDAYCYNHGWIDTGYLYNIAKGAMTVSNIFGSAQCKDYYLYLKHRLDRSDLTYIELFIGKE